MGDELCAADASISQSHGRQIRTRRSGAGKRTGTRANRSWPFSWRFGSRWSPGRCDKQHGFRACGFTQHNIASGTVVIDSSGRRFFEEELARCDRRSYLCNGRKNSTAERCNQRNQLRLPKRFDVALRSRICEESGQDRDQVAGWISANGSCHEIRS